MTGRSFSKWAPRLLKQMKLDSLVITRGGDGMAAFEKKKAPLEIPIYGDSQVVDVTGAGDTVIATYTAALAAGGPRLGSQAGKLRGRHRGDETRNCDREPRRTAGRTGAIAGMRQLSGGSSSAES